MLVAIIGENCVGKSTLANKINEKFHAKVYSGKDYLRLEKNPSMALEKFKTILKESVTGDHIIYLITEIEHLNFLPAGTFKIVLTAELEVIKERFKERMRGNLPLPLEKMLESKHGMYDDLECHLRLDANYDIEEVINRLGI
ncbi:MAG: hypothetical protein K2I42_06225 [Anaeroplasmataceae bacterium]|nr:hypothetical protein [Anaeroplasmataceae bacterium]